MSPIQSLLLFHAFSFDIWPSFDKPFKMKYRLVFLNVVISHVQWNLFYLQNSLNKASEERHLEAVIQASLKEVQSDAVVL